MKNELKGIAVYIQRTCIHGIDCIYEFDLITQIIPK